MEPDTTLLLTPDGIGPLVDVSLNRYAALDTAERRRWRARFEPMVVVPWAADGDECTGLYDVLRPDDGTDPDEPRGVSWYTVDAVDGRCDCPFGESDRDGRCKHLTRVHLAIRESDLPAPSEPATGCWDRLRTIHARLADRPDMAAVRRTLGSLLADRHPAKAPGV